MEQALSAVDRIFDLIAGGTPMTAMLEAGWAVEDAAEDGDEARAIRAMAASLREWAAWTEGGAIRQMSDLPADYLEEVTLQAGARGVEAWRELSVRAALERDPVTSAALDRLDAEIEALDRVLAGAAGEESAPAAAMTAR